MPINKTLYIVRHAQTDFNLKKIVQGRGINAPINETGVRQAQLFWQHYQTQNFDKLYISSLQRTAQTLEPFMVQGTPHESLSGLDEFDWGIYEGKIGNYETQAEYLQLISAWRNGDYDAKPVGGESPNEVALRQRAALNHIFSHENEEKVLICTHGRAMRLLMCMVLEQPFYMMDSFLHQNTCLYIVKIINDQPILVAENNVAHLKATQ